MKANHKFQSQPKEFWATVRTISQEVGYTHRGNTRKGIPPSIKIPTLSEVREAFKLLELRTAHIADEDDALTDFGKMLFDYFKFRAEVLNTRVKGLLMHKKEAEVEFSRLRKELKPKCLLPMNKQKGEKKAYAYMTGIVNMLIEANIGDAPCNYNPLSLTTMTHDAMPLRTLSRRVDGTFPSVVNPIAIWEIKEYYHTTSFGSRVADGVYETLLDGMELEELEGAAQRKVQHVLFLDAYATWWEKGRSYLCRIIDMLHTGHVGEVIFGREALLSLPAMARAWKVSFDNLSAKEREAHRQRSK